MTDAADLLAWQLTTTKHTGWVRELRFHPPRRWRIDLAFPAQRHGEASAEVRQARALIASTSQLYFDFNPPTAPKSIDRQVSGRH